MGKRTPLACSESNCGENFSRCGKKSTYVHRKCRCDECRAAMHQYQRQYASERRSRGVGSHGECSKENCGASFPSCGTISNYMYGCRCQSCRSAAAQSEQRYASANPDQISQKNRNWREANKEHCREYQLRYMAENAEYARKATLRAKDWKKANPERARDNARQSEQRRRARKQETAVVPFTSEQVEQRFEYYGNRCYLGLKGCSGNPDEMDHVKPLAKFGPHILANIRPACKSCNSSKRDKWPFNFKEQRDSVPRGRQPQRP